MAKITNIIKYVLLVIGVISIIPVFLKGESGVDFMLTWAAVLLGLAVVVTLLLAGFNIVNNPKGATRSLIGIGAMVVVIGISWALASSEPVVTPVETFNNYADLMVADTGLYTTYIIFIAAILVSIIGEIRNSFK